MSHSQAGQSVVFHGIVTIRYRVEADDKDAADRLIAGVAASTERSGVRSRRGADGSAEMVAVKAQVKSR